MDPERTDKPWARRARTYLRVIGSLCAIVALVLGGMIAYETWGTGLATAREQDRLADAFEDQVAAATSTTTTTAPPTTTTRVAPATSPPTSAATASSVPDTSSPVESSSPPEVVPRTVVQDLPPIVRGEAIAQLSIPAIGQDLFVVPGVEFDDLRLGPGHYPGTPLPGQLGNAAIAGHRTGYGAPFFDVDLLGAGDDIIVTLGGGQRYVYEVTSIEIVSPTDSWVIRTTNPFRATLTLTSCEPKWTTRERIIVHAVLDKERSDPVGVATFYGIGDDGSIESSSGDEPDVPQAQFGR